MNLLSKSCGCFALMALSMGVFAQQKTRPDPSDPKVSVPPVVYISPLEQYRPLGDEGVISWKTANEVVDKAGGWKSYAREAQQAEPEKVPSTTPSPRPTAQPDPAVSDGQAGQKKN